MTGTKEWDVLSNRRWTNDEAVAAVTESQRAGASFVILPGSIAGDLVMPVPVGLAALQVTAAIDGSAVVNCTARCDVQMKGTIGGDLHLAGELSGVYVGEAVAGDVVVAGHLAESLAVVGRVDGQVVVRNAADAAGLAVQGEIGALVVEGEVRGNVRVFEDVHGMVRIPGRVGGSVFVAAPVTGGITVFGAVDGVLSISGQQVARVAVEGGVTGGVKLRGRFAESVTLVPRRTESVPLASVAGARFEHSVHIGDRVSIVECDFRQCGDLDKLDLIGADLFRRVDGTLADELTKPEGASDGEMGSIYRQLRVNLEGKGNRPASAFFYRGEMDSRRRAAWTERRWGEWAWISLYRWVAGYGLRVTPPLAWFVGAWVVATTIFLLRGLVVLHGGEYVSASWWQAASFTLQSMLSVFRPPDAVLGLGTTVVQVVLRILGPILLGLAALAVRDKVAR